MLVRRISEFYQFTARVNGNPLFQIAHFESNLPAENKATLPSMQAPQVSDWVERVEKEDMQPAPVGVATTSFETPARIAPLSVEFDSALQSVEVPDQLFILGTGVGTWEDSPGQSSRI